MQGGQAGPRRGRLKTATSAAHRELDTLISALELHHPRDYLLFLEASAAALLPLERLLQQAEVEQALQDWPRRARAAALHADLAELHGVAPEITLGRQALSPPQVTGVVYVLEGSRLGARVLRERVPRGCMAMSYLSAGDAGLWPSFLAQLEAPAMPWDPLETTAAARWAFGIFRRAFATVLPARPAAAC